MSSTTLNSIPAPETRFENDVHRRIRIGDVEIDPVELINARDGMKFRFGARLRSGEYTPRQSFTIVDMARPGAVQHTKPLRVKFREHTWDSKAAQQANGWNDEERRFCELYLLTHRDFGRVDGKGIHLDQAARQWLTPGQTPGVYEISGGSSAMFPTPQGAPLTRVCQFMFEVGADVVQCGKPVSDPDADYCPSCQADIEQATADTLAHLDPPAPAPKPKPKTQPKPKARKPAAKAST